MKRLSVMMFSLLMVFGVAGNVSADDFESRIFKNKETWHDMVVTRSLETAPECEGGKREVLRITGHITSNAAREVAGMVKSLPQCPMRKVYLLVDNGFTEGGIDLGKLFKKYNVHTVVSAWGECGWTCWLAFIGGRERTMENNSRLVIFLPCHWATGSGRQKKCAKQTVRYLSNHIREMLGYNEMSKAIIEKGLIPDKEWTLYEANARINGLVTN